MEKNINLGTLPNWAEPHFKTRKRFHLVVAHRKAKKTKVAFSFLAFKAMQKAGHYWYIAQSQSICKENIWNNGYIYSSIPKDLIVARDASRLMTKIKCLNGGYSFIYLKGADRPDLMRGPTPFGVVIDEYATLKPEVWYEIVSPIIYANPEAWVWICGTFKGANHFYELYLDAVSHQDAWQVTFLPASKSGIIPPAALEEARKSSRQEVYDQEYECKVVTDATHFFKGVDDVFNCNFEKYDYTCPYFAGIDFGRVRDATVCKIFNGNTNHEANSLEIINKPFSFQVKKLTEFLKSYNAFAFCDATSMGSRAAYEDLKTVYPKVDGINFNNRIKVGMLDNLAIFIENKYVSLAREDLKLKDQLKRYEYDVKDNGILTLGTQKGSDDHVIACALGVYQLSKRTPKKEDKKEISIEEMRKLEDKHLIEVAQQKAIDRLNGFDNEIWEEYNY